MTAPQFAQMATNYLNKVDNNEYTNARYAPLGNATVGSPFLAYREYGGRLMSWGPSSYAESNLKRQMNLPTNNTMFRNAQENNGVGIANQRNNAWVYRTQTLANNDISTISCSNNTDCASMPGTTCNPNYSSWNDSKGNQGNYCSNTEYPEFSTGEYLRKTANEGGIGKGCFDDRDCSTGYKCNNETDMFGKNIQQTGYCSQTYNCPDGKTHYLGYPYNSGIPIAPSPDQNKGGRGYATKEECLNEKSGAQDCMIHNGSWFATYPGFCPVEANMRQGNNPQGALLQSNSSIVQAGIVIPAYETNKSSSIGNFMPTFESWNINATPSKANNMSSPLAYELSINPK